MEVFHCQLCVILPQDRPQKISDDLEMATRFEFILGLFKINFNCFFQIIMVSYRETPNNDFDRSYSEFKNGFATADQQTIWYGLENIYTVTNQAAYSLLIGINHMGVWKFALYDDFRILSEEYGYQLFVSGYDASNSDIPDELSSHNYFDFAAPDTELCASYYKSGWWFQSVSVSGSCSRATNLMGWTQPNNTHQGKVWGSFTNITQVWMAVMRKGLLVFQSHLSVSL